MTVQNRKINAVRNIFFGVIYKMIVLLIPFVIRTILLSKLGTEYLGLSSLFSSILQAMSLAELGFGSAMVYSMYKPIAENDTDKICALLGLFKKIYTLIGCLILVISLILTPFLGSLIKGDYPNSVNLYALFYIYLANTLVSYFFFAYKQALIGAKQRSDITSKVGACVNIGLYICQILALLLFENYYIYIIFLPISTVINNLVVSHVVDRMYPEIHAKGTLTKSDIKEITKRVGALTGHRLSGTIVRSVDNIVISSFFGLTILAIYNNYFSMINAIIGILSIVNTSVTASIGNSIALESVEKNQRDFQKVVLLYSWLVSFCVIALVVLFQPFMTLWMGKDLLFDMPIIILFGAYLFFYLIRQPVLIYKDACGMWWADRLKPYFEAASNLIMNIILVNIIGLPGVIISTIISMAIVAMPWEIHALYKNYFKKGELDYWVKLIQYGVFTITMTWTTWEMCSLLSTDNVWLNFIISGLICVTLPNIAFILVFGRTTEFRDVREMSIKMLGKLDKSVIINNKKKILD